jgi:hypothetical protein
VQDKKIILGAVLALAAAGAAGQTVWRCGNSYGTRPCAGGSALETPEPPSAADSAHAAKAAAADARRAEAMEKVRLAQEKNAPKAIVMAPKEPPKPEPRKTAAQKGKLDTFTAVAPGTGGKANKKK